MESQKTFTVLGNVNLAEGLAALNPAKRRAVKLIDAYRSYPPEIWRDMIAACFNDPDKSDATAGLRRWRQATRSHLNKTGSTDILGVVKYMLDQDSATLGSLARRYCPALYEDAHKLIGKPVTGAALEKLYAESLVPQSRPNAGASGPILSKK